MSIMDFFTLFSDLDAERQRGEANALNEQLLNRRMGIFESLAGKYFGGVPYGRSEPYDYSRGANSITSTGDWLTGPNSLLGQLGQALGLSPAPDAAQGRTRRSGGRPRDGSGGSGSQGGYFNELYDTINRGTANLESEGRRSASDLVNQVGQGYDQFEANTSESNRALQSGYGGLERLAGAGYGGLTDSYGQQYGELDEAYGDRLAEAMGIVNRIGGQERKDIMDTSRESLQGDLQGLTNRGLGATTITSAARRGNQEQLTDALGRFQDRQATRQLGTYLGASGEQLGARERGIGETLGARERGIGAQLAARSEGLGAQERGIGREMQAALAGLASQENLGRFQHANNLALAQNTLNTQQNLGERLFDQEVGFLMGMNPLNSVSYQGPGGGLFDNTLQWRVAQEQADAQKQAADQNFWGQLGLSSASTAAGYGIGAAFAPFTGGASLWAGPAAGGLGGGMPRMFG